MKLGMNVGTTDRVVRIVLGVALAAIALAGAVSAPLLYVVWVVAAIAVVTGVVGFCPLYAVLRVSTKPSAH
ncbi:MAG: YgaP-like transmembrane domain [Acidimicrobiales bacterium]